MRLDPRSPPKRPRESIVPMINVVFLLLIFFLMTAVIAPPDPFDLTLPDAEGAELGQMPDALYLSGDGDLAYGPARGEAVFAALAGHQGVLELRADAGVEAATLARLLPRLARLGIGDVVLVTRP